MRLALGRARRLGNDRSQLRASCAGRNIPQARGFGHNGVPSPDRVPMPPAYVSPSPCSLTPFMIEEKRAGRVDADLRLLIEVVARTCKTIAVAVGKGALGGVCSPVVPRSRRATASTDPARCWC